MGSRAVKEETVVSMMTGQITLCNAHMKQATAQLSPPTVYMIHPPAPSLLLSPPEPNTLPQPPCNLLRQHRLLHSPPPKGSHTTPPSPVSPASPRSRSNQVYHSPPP
jgi:hypothetical protein